MLFSFKSNRTSKNGNLVWVETWYKQIFATSWPDHCPITKLSTVTRNLLIIRQFDVTLDHPLPNFFPSMPGLPSLQSHSASISSTEVTTLHMQTRVPCSMVTRTIYGRKGLGSEVFFTANCAFLSSRVLSHFASTNSTDNWKQNGITRRRNRFQNNPSPIKSYSNRWDEAFKQLFGVPKRVYLIIVRIF